MKHRPNIDDFFKTGLEGAGPDYKEEYWNKLEPILASTKIEGFVIREYLLMGIVILIQSLLVFGYPKDRNSQTVQDATAIPEHTITQDFSQKSESSVSKDPEQASGITENDAVESIAERHNVLLNPMEFAEQTNPNPNQIETDIVQSIDSEQESFEYKVSSADEEHFKMSKIGLSSLSTWKQPKSKAKMIKNVGPQISPFRFLLEPYLGYQVYKRSFDQQALNSIKDNEHARSNYLAGLHFRLSKGPWSLQTGLGLNQVSERVSYVKESNSFTYDSTLKVVNWNYGLSPSGTHMILVDWERDSTSQVIEEEICKDCITNFTYLSLPVQVQYGLSIGRIEYFGGIGLNTQFLIGSKGTYVLEEEPVQLNGRDKGLSPLVFTANLTFGLRGNIYGPFGYSLSYNYLHGLNSMTENYMQKARFQSINLGFSIEL